MEIWNKLTQNFAANQKMKKETTKKKKICSIFITFSLQHVSVNTLCYAHLWHLPTGRGSRLLQHIHLISTMATLSLTCVTVEKQVQIQMQTLFLPVSEDEEHAKLQKKTILKQTSPSALPLPHPSPHHTISAHMSVTSEKSVYKWNSIWLCFHVYLGRFNWCCNNTVPIRIQTHHFPVLLL